MKIKKFAVLFLCALMMLSFAACGKKGGDSAENNTATTLAVNTETQSASEDAQGEVDVTETKDPQTEAVSPSYFDDAAFVGDSVSLKLSYYAASTGELGNAQFFTSGSLGANNALWDLDHPDSVHPSYRGEKMLIEDCIANSGASKVYLMLGMNDLALYGIDATIESYQTLIGNILEKSPEAKIIIQSMTPMTDTSYLWGDYLNNDVIREYNIALESLCAEKGWGFVDVASVMYDDGGNLIREYCSDPDDMGVHFEEAGCDAWIKYLSTHI